MNKINYFRYIAESVVGESGIGIRDYISYNLMYEWKFNGEYYHNYTFSGVLEDIIWEFENDLDEYNFDFSEFRDQYSKQEMTFLNLLIEQLKKDRKELNLLYTKLKQYDIILM